MVNECMQETWATSGRGWVENETMFDQVFTPFTHALLGAAAIEPGDRVLDVGCGSGTLLEHATRLGATAVGVDISEAMVAAAQRRVPGATVRLADAQTADLTPDSGQAFNRVVSRFGVMFFEDPSAAFANIRRSIAAGGRLTFVCWRSDDDPLMFTLGTSVLTDRLGGSGAVADPAAPGPLAFADADRVREILTDAGWDDIGIEPVDGMCDYGIDGSDGVEERLAMVLSTTTGQRARAALEPSLGLDGWAALVDDVRAEIRRHTVDGVVKFIGRTWLVTAGNPST
ncbi:class I SAM-dependent methyltransferase [Gordonia sp. LSe1-13]|uniref:Class I SAM-dependent methyltransferase n=1 Tax=Gordonia sesuvii TaxID=3116777 RepID=A0ABU7MK42_9ACTN|nr:class I SAM-dependent methyltransferase [Gordonia sp. LSe1-13]